MNIVPFRPVECTRAREALDLVLDGEAPADVEEAVHAHVAQCEACSEELGSRERLRASVRRAAGRDVAPAALQAEILARVRGAEAPAETMPSDAPPATARASAPAHSFRSWVAAAAAVVLLAASAAAVLTWRGHSGDARVAVVDPIAADAEILRVGLGDHAHCALQRPLPPALPAREAILAKLGPTYEGLLDAVAERIPPGFALVEAHACSFSGRRFVHFVLRSDETVLSVIVTRKNGETFDRRGLFAVLQGSGVEVYRDEIQGLQVDGFETRDHLAFVVSGLSAERNFRVAADLAAPVRRVLVAAEA